jgi:hypothetical protein
MLDRVDFTMGVGSILDAIASIILGIPGVLS